MDNQKIVDIVKHCLQRAGYSETEALMFIKKLSQITEYTVRWEDNFWSYTDVWGAEGPDCIFVRG